MPLVRLSEDEEPAPNLAPMIDVVLVLTIFFMCATKFSGDERKFDLELPQAANATAVQGRPRAGCGSAPRRLRSGNSPAGCGCCGRRSPS